MVRRKTLIALFLVAAAWLVAGSASAMKPRDDFFNRQDPGTRLKLFPFFGPGFRAILENRASIEKDMSELQTQVIGDVNPGYSEGSLNFDARFFLLSFGASVGYRNDWHILKFEPDQTSTPGVPRDHGERELNRKARWLKQTGRGLQRSSPAG